MSSAEANSNFKYEFGFLEEAAASSISFLNAPDTNQISFIKLSGPPELLEGAYIESIELNKEGMIKNKFRCLVKNSKDDILFNYIDFENADENLLGTNTIHGVLGSTNDCCITYAIRVNDSQIPADDIKNYRYESEVGVKYYLSPFALEPNAGNVVFQVETHTTDLDNSNSNIQTIDPYLTPILGFKEGYNYDLSTLKQFQIPTFELAASAGSGLGRIPCDLIDSTSELVITTINKQAPNETGNININSGDAECLTVDSTPANKTIKVDAHCAPCCRCSDYTKTGKFIRSYATTYVKLAKKYKELVNEYNRINEEFENQGGTCCDTFGEVNPRFRIWPQQNFMLQVQALMENNTSGPVCLCGVELTIEAQVIADEGSPFLSEEEQLSNGEIVTHSILDQKYLIVTPLKEASYVYFKGVNPGNKGLTIDMEDGTEDGPAKKLMKISLLMDQVAEGSSTSCTDNSNQTTALPFNCMEACSGYLMLTGGLTISDPVFRKIVHLRQKRLAMQNTEFNGIPILLKSNFRYAKPNTPNNPCATCGNPNSWDWIRIPNNGITKRVLIAANRKSVDPCSPVRIKSLSAADDPSDLLLIFTGNVITGSNTQQPATVNIVRKAFVDSDWQSAGQANYNIDTSVETNSITISNVSYDADLPEGTTAISYTVSLTGTGLISKCYPNPNDPDNYIEINVAPSLASYSVRV